MSKRDWDAFQARHYALDDALANELREMGIRNPTDVTDIDLAYNFDTELWEVTMKTDYPGTNTFIFEDSSPTWYYYEIQRDFAGSLYDEYGGDFTVPPTIPAAYKRSKGTR